MKIKPTLLVVLVSCAAISSAAEPRPPAPPINIAPPAITTDKSVRYDYDIVYVRGTRRPDGKEARYLAECLIQLEQAAIKSKESFTF